MKKYLEKRIAYYKREIPIAEESLKGLEGWNYDTSIEKLFNMKASLHECERQLKTKTG